MTTIQRIIKYLAIGLAIFIIIAISSGVLLGLNIYSDLLGLTRTENLRNEIKTEVQVNNKNTKVFNSEIKNLKIDLAYASLDIIQGDKFKVETNSVDINSKQNGNQLVIKEKSNNWFKVDNNRRVIVTIPKNVTLDIARIEAGAGQLQIEKLITKSLNLDIGAGKVTIQELQVTENSKIEGGAGKVEILSGKLNNLDLDMGVGNFAITATLTGNNKVDAGVGKLDLKLEDGTDNYTIRVNKGIGSIKLNNKEISNNKEYGTGKTRTKNIWRSRKYRNWGIK